MECPACANDLTTTKAGRITVDACEGSCGGIWFDRYELMRVDETDESVHFICPSYYTPGKQDWGAF